MGAQTSSVAMADTWVPKGYEASGQGFLSSIRSLGMFVGFCLAALFEDRALYRVLAGIVTVGTAILGIGQYHATTKCHLEKGRDSTNNLTLTSESHTCTVLEL